MLDRWNQAIALVEERLHDEVDVAELARVALTSEYHFRRVFSALAGMPISEYVRRRRLTVATAEVVDGRSSVLDVAVRYGYGSGDAFTRAFKTLHGLTPAQARRRGAVLHSQPRLSFHLSIEGASTMRHRIEHTDAFRIVGRHARIPLQYEGENPAMTDFHAGLPADLDARLRAVADVAAFPDVLLVSSGFTEGREDGSLFDYRRGAATTRAATELDDDLDVLEVGASQWVVFEAEGSLPDELPGAVQRLWADSFSEWFPSNPYRIVPGPEILHLTGMTQTHGRGELWLPVERDPA